MDSSVLNVKYIVGLDTNGLRGAGIAKKSTNAFVPNAIVSLKTIVTMESVVSVRITEVGNVHELQIN
jgi:hypothetical protein